MEPQYSPSSIYATLRKSLCDEGLSKDEGDAVMALYMEKKKDVLGSRWNDPADDYSRSLLQIIKTGLSLAALDWLAERSPERARTLFERLQDANKELRPAPRATAGSPPRSSAKNAPKNDL